MPFYVQADTLTVKGGKFTDVAGDLKVTDYSKHEHCSTPAPTPNPQAPAPAQTSQTDRGRKASSATGML